MKLKNLLLALAAIAFFAQCQAPTNQNNSATTTTTALPNDSILQQTTPNLRSTESAKTAETQQIQNSRTPSVNGAAQPETNTASLDLPIDAALLYKGFAPKSQTYDLDGSEIKRIECKGGTIVLVNPKSFEYEDGTPVPSRTTVTLNVTEYLQRSDMLLSPLTTTTLDGKTLETGGMIHAYAYTSGRKCRLKKDSVMRVGFKVTDDDRFQLFDGSTGNSNLVEWALSSDPQPVTSMTHSTVDKRPRFVQTNLEDYIAEHISRTPAMKKYKAEGFTLCAFVTIDKVGKVVAQRLAENKDTYMDMGIDTAFLGMIKRMPNWMPAFKKGKPVRARAMVTINFSGFRDESASIKVASNEAYAAAFNLTVDKLLTVVDDDILTFPIKRLGWINCDRFYNDLRPKAQLLVEANGQNADVKLIFKKLNAIMPISRMKNRQFKSADIPIGEPVFVVGIRKEGDQLYFGMQETTVDNKTIALNFSPISDTELKEKLKGLNN